MTITENMKVDILKDLDELDAMLEKLQSKICGLKRFSMESREALND